MAFPVVLDPTTPPNSENPTQGASRIRAIIQNLLDLFNLPTNTNIAAALAITRVGPYTNSTGVTLVAGDVVALDTAVDSSVVLADSQTSQRQFVVALATITNASTGVFGQTGLVTVTTQGVVTRGRYLRKSATTKALEDSGILQANGTAAPVGSVGVALTASAGGAATVVAQMFGVTVPAQPTAGYSIRRLVGQNDVGTPNTKYGYSADLVTLRNPTDNSTVVRSNTGTLTNDTGATGPVADGRDAAGAFGVSSWVHFYLIWNGTTLSTLSSATAPPTGPVLPTGYTHWAYVGGVFFNGASQLVKTRMLGSAVFYEAQQVALSGGNAAVETSVSLTSLIPPNAQTALIHAQIKAPRNAAGGAGDDVLTLRVITAVDFITALQTRDNSGTGNLANDFMLEIPNIAQTMYYLMTATSIGGTATNTNLWVSGYHVPNGGD